MSRVKRSMLILGVLAAAAVAACDSDDDGSAATGTGVVVTETTDASGSAATTPPPTTDPSPTTGVPVTSEADTIDVGGWSAVAGGPECECSDGSPFEIWERRADPTRVVLYFEGGGACFSAETCGPESDTFTKTVELGLAPRSEGIFDADDPRNPLAGHSMVYVPYCTGDVHLGDRTTEYSDTVTIEHNGFPNARFGLDRVIEQFPDVEQLVVAGASAGSIPTPAFAGLAADELPGVEIITFGDSSAAYPDVPELNAGIGALWGVLENVPDWPVNEGLAPEDWSFPGLYVQSGTQHPDITFARFDYAYDDVQAGFAALAGIAADDLLAFIEQTEADIEAAGVPIASYIAPGTAHTVIGRPEFYDLEVDGFLLVDFFADLVAGEVPADIRCVDCGRPS
jgi:hypothetical protein